MGVNYAILSLLAIYGVISILLDIFKCIGRKNCFVNKANIVLLVNDQEKNIERMVRDAFESKFVRNVINNGNFTIVDMDSKDDTLKILRKLENQFPLLEICSFDERNCIFCRGKSVS